MQLKANSSNEKVIEHVLICIILTTIRYFNVKRMTWQVPYTSCQANNAPFTCCTTHAGQIKSKNPLLILFYWSFENNLQVLLQPNKAYFKAVLGCRS